MTSHLALATKDAALVRELLRLHLPDREVRAFGSRVRRTAKPTSDLDLCVMGEHAPDPVVLDRLRDAFAASRLPMKVDIAVFAALPPVLQQNVLAASVRVS